MSKKQLVVGALEGRIYDAQILKNGDMSKTGRVDRTDECIHAVASFLHLAAETNAEQKGTYKLFFPGFGTMTWQSETAEKEEENAEPEQTI